MGRIGEYKSISIRSRHTTYLPIQFYYQIVEQDSANRNIIF